MSTALIIVVGWLLASVVAGVVWILLARWLRGRREAEMAKWEWLHRVRQRRQRRRPHLPRQRGDDGHGGRHRRSG